MLFLDAVLNGFCGIAENRSELFYERCEGPAPNLPLYAIALVLAAPFLRRFVSGALVFMVGALLVLFPILISAQLLSV